MRLPFNQRGLDVLRLVAPGQHVRRHRLLRVKFEARTTREATSYQAILTLNVLYIRQALHFNVHSVHNAECTLHQESTNTSMCTVFKNPQEALEASATNLRDLHLSTVRVRVLGGARQHPRPRHRLTQIQEKNMNSRRRLNSKRKLNSRSCLKGCALLCLRPIDQCS
jgi:hypothetical protein